MAQEVKDLDQDARGSLRKHGIRFGQFTVFMPLLLKPAPTRLRLVLWSLAGGLDEFPEAPPPGLVTVPAVKDAPEGYHAMCGYREAGERAIRIDMLERLADLLRVQDSRAGFEATPDMLSITGMTLEQFSGLMEGLGYRAERGEREKQRPVDAVVPEAAADPAEAPAVEDTPADLPEGADLIPDAGVAPEAETPAEPAPEAVAERIEDGQPSETELPIGAPADAAVEGPEIEVFYTFTWGRRTQQNARPKGQRTGKPKPQQGARPQGKGGKPRGKQGKPPNKGGKTFSARPPRDDKKIDPDNPFAAALMGLRDNK